MCPWAGRTWAGPHGRAGGEPALGSRRVPSGRGGLRALRERGACSRRGAAVASGAWSWGLRRGLIRRTSAAGESVRDSRQDEDEEERAREVREREAELQVRRRRRVRERRRGIVAKTDHTALDTYRGHQQQVAVRSQRTDGTDRERRAPDEVTGGGADRGQLTVLEPEVDDPSRDERRAVDHERGELVVPP